MLYLYMELAPTERGCDFTYVISVGGARIRSGGGQRDATASLLSSPDLLPWHDDSTYSQAAAARLVAAFAHAAVDDAPPASHVREWHSMKALLDNVLAPPQRVRALTLRARASEAEDAYTDALEYIDQAREVAEYRPLWPEIADLLLYRAKIERARLRYVAAVNDIDMSLARLRQHADQMNQKVPAALEIEIYTMLSEYSYFTGDLPRAVRAAHEAQRFDPHHQRLIDRGHVTLGSSAHSTHCWWHPTAI